MTFEQLFAIIRARWIAAISAFLLIAGTVAAVTLLLPKKYTATGSVVVDIRSPDPIAGTVLMGIAQPSFLMTQIDIIASKRVAMKVVATTKLNQSDLMHQKWAEATDSTGSFEQWLADVLLKNMEVRPSRGSNVIYLSYTSPDPVFSAAIVNAFIQGYLEASMELRTTPAKQYSELFNANEKALRDQLEQAQLRLSQYQQQQGLIITDERMDIETARLNELTTQLVALQGVLADSGSRQAAVQSQTDRSPDIIANPLIASLKGDLVRQESQLKQLTARYGDQHPSVIELKSNIEEMRNRLDIETRRVAGSLSVNNSVNASRLAQVKAQLDEQRAKVLRMKTIRDQASLLQRDVDTAERALEGVAMRKNSTNLESQAQQGSVAALEYAQPPSLPSSPRVLINIALGIVVGGIVAMALALFLEVRDRRLRTIAEIEPLLQQAVIGQIPSFKHEGKSAVALPQRLGITQPRLKALPNKT